MWHSCVRLSLTHHFAGRPPELREAFDKWLALFRRVGPVRVIPQKSRICFQVRIRFAGAVVHNSWLDAGVWLPGRVEHPLLVRVEDFQNYNSHGYGHHFKFTDPRQVDDSFLPWVRESYEIGAQRWQNRTKP